VKQIGRELGVRYVLEGSLRKSGNRIRVTAQLVEAQIGNHVWAERYDRDLADIFAVQDEITEARVAQVPQPALIACPGVEIVGGFVHRALLLGLGNCWRAGEDEQREADHERLREAFAMIDPGGRSEAARDPSTNARSY
jgi:hypothetical protein